MVAIRFYVFMLAAAAFLTFEHASAQTANEESIAIATSAKCDMCKDKLEDEMRFVKGINSTSLDVETAVLTVSYNPQKTEVEKIRSAINKIGYDADQSPANPKAKAYLPDCCKKLNK